jgi:hypothetical protein
LSTTQAIRALLYKNGSIVSQFPTRGVGNGSLISYKMGGSVNKVPVIAGDTLAVYMISDVASTLGTSSGDNRLTFSME